jgi:hypothetical protein
MIIPAKSQFNLKFQPMRIHYGPWQPCWISNQHQIAARLKKRGSNLVRDKKDKNLKSMLSTKVMN